MPAPKIRRTAIPAAILLLVLPLLLRPPTPAQESSPTRTVERIVIPVADLERSVRFYSSVLSFEPIGQTAGGVARLRLGREVIELVESVGGCPPRSVRTTSWRGGRS